jgi:aryl-alcohol dehydrogenase-like predicted oxidoreductase
MDYRTLGRTGLRVPILGFGCGNVGGLIIRGTAAERERAVARALELGITYFDTAPSYGDGQSEQNLGQAIRALKADVAVGTKFRLAPTDLADAPRAIARSLDASLRRLALGRVDVLHLHNPVTLDRRPGSVSAKDLLDVIVAAGRKVVEQGKARFFGITALGDTAALLPAVDAGGLDSAQVCYNLLNPSAAHPVPPGFPAQDFSGLLTRCGDRGTGVMVIRVLAAGAMSGADARHPIAAPTVDPIATGADYAADVERARAFRTLVDAGHVESLVEASLRFPLATPAVSTVLVGISSLDQLEYAARCIAKGPLPPEALALVRPAWDRLAGRR